MREASDLVAAAAREAGDLVADAGLVAEAGRAGVGPPPQRS